MRTFEVTAENKDFNVTIVEIFKAKNLTSPSNKIARELGTIVTVTKIVEVK